MESEKSKKSGMAISALTLGIISIITSLFYYISIPTGILAIIFGGKSTHNTGTKIGKAGLVTGIVGVSICAFLYISMVCILVLSERF